MPNPSTPDHANTPDPRAKPLRNPKSPPTATEEVTVKQKRAAKTAAKLAEVKRAQANARRKRLTIIVGAWAAAAAVIVSLVILAITSTTPKGSPTAEIEGLRSFPGLSSNHVTGPVTYEQTPPAGGDHSVVLLNCGVYSEQVPNENAVHSLEHGSVWITYDPDRLTADQVTALRKTVPGTYAILSPYKGLPSPIIASAWGAQVQLDSPEDPRLSNFIAKYRKAQTAPEPGAPCSGGLDGPGKIS